MSNFLFFSSPFHFTACFLVLLLHFLTKAWFNNRVIINTVLLVLNCLLYDIIYDHHEYFLYLSRSVCFYRYQKYQSVRVNCEKWIYLEEIFIQNLTVLKSLPWLAIPTNSSSSLSLPNHLVNINSLYCLPYIFYHFSSLNLLLSEMICFSLMIIFTCPVALVCAC